MMLNFKRLIVYFIFSSTLFLGLIFNENSSGGAKIDHEYLKENCFYNILH